jgi:hypothetical protein
MDTFRLNWRAVGLISVTTHFVALFGPSLIPDDCYAQTGDPFLPGEYRIGHQVIVPVDGARNNRQVRTMIWYPAKSDVTEGVPIRYSRPFGWMQPSPYIGGLMDAPTASDGPFPLVVLSHGAGGVPNQFEPLGELLASHGYVVAAPQHVGDSGGTTPLPAMRSHRPADMSFVIDTMLNRSSMPGDILSDAIKADAVAVGGFSRGASTATATISGLVATNTGEFGIPPDPRATALVLIDGFPNLIDLLPAERRATVQVPTLTIGGHTGSFSLNSALLPVANPMYGVDVINASHGDFVTPCSFLNSLFESDAPQEVLNFFGVRGPIECGPGLFPPW